MWVTMAQAMAKAKQDEEAAAEEAAQLASTQAAAAAELHAQQKAKQIRLEQAFFKECQEQDRKLRQMLGRRWENCDEEYTGTTRKLKDHHRGWISLLADQCIYCKDSYCLDCIFKYTINCDWCWSDNSICLKCQSKVCEEK